MSCESVQRELVAFHFGEVSEAARREVEGHLQTCPACLRDYLALKRGVETAEGEPAPSPSFRARLRGAVAAELGLAPQAWRWWERPFAFGFASVAVLLAMLAMHGVATAPAGPPRDRSIAAQEEPR